MPPLASLPTNNHPDSRRRKPCEYGETKTKIPCFAGCPRTTGRTQEVPTEPDFGPALSVPAYEAEMNGYAADETSYNQDLAALDDKQNRLDARESGLKDLNLRIQAAVKAQFGPDSSEYELVGGTRRSDRKKPKRKGSRGSTTNK